MRQKSVATTVVLAIVTSAVIFSGARAFAQTPVSLQEQLAAQYKLVKMGSDTSGYSVVEKGTLLAIQKGGILGVPYGDSQVPATKYEGGTVKGPSGMSLLGRKTVMGRFGKEQTTHLFPSGDKVYPTKIDVNLDKDTVSMGIVACDTCNKTDPPTYNKAQVVFQFPKGTLAKAAAGEVEDTIGQLLSISDDTQSDQGSGQQADQGAQQQAGGGQQAAQPEQQAEPAEVKLGMTTDQVEAALGKPDKKVTLGPKQIYIYKDMKVTFKDGKVSDVQ